MPDRATLARLDDEEIIERLTQVRGIGRWTVEMLLMFHLGRPDVLPVDDFGVRAGFAPPTGCARCRTRRRSPPRASAGSRTVSAAAWYLWRALELKRAGTLPAPAERIRLPRIAEARARGGKAARQGAPAGTRRQRAACAPSETKSSARRS